MSVAIKAASIQSRSACPIAKLNAASECRPQDSARSGPRCERYDSSAVLSFLVRGYARVSRGVELTMFPNKIYLPPNGSSKESIDCRDSRVRI
jgi:hypothetical protein